MNQLDPIAFLLIALATWRVSFMLTKEAGPLDVFTRLRVATKGAGGLLTCPYCLSVWMAFGMLGLWLLGGAGQVMVVGLAVSAGALMLSSYTGVAHGT